MACAHNLANVMDTGKRSGWGDACNHFSSGLGSVFVSLVLHQLLFNKMTL